MNCHRDTEEKLNQSDFLMIETLHRGGESCVEFGKRPRLKKAGSPGTECRQFESLWLNLGINDGCGS